MQTFNTASFRAVCRLGPEPTLVCFMSSLCDPECAVRCYLVSPPLFPQKSLWKSKQNKDSSAADTIFSIFKISSWANHKSSFVCIHEIGVILMPYWYCESQWEAKENWSLLRTTHVQLHRCMIKMYGKKENKIETYLKCQDVKATWRGRTSY